MTVSTARPGSGGAPDPVADPMTAPNPARSGGRQRARRPTPWQLLLGNASATVGVVVLLLVVLGAALANVLAPADPLAQSIADRLVPPSFTAGAASHPLGTDQLGRDILSRILYGARVSLMVGLLGAGLSAVVGTALGMVGAYYGGWLDRVIVRVANIQLAFPFILLVITIVAVLGPGLQNIILALGISGWVTFARMARTQVLQIRAREFVTAARATGAGNGRILIRHILPSTLSPLIVLASFAVAQMIILESALSFLGLGTPPTTPTWGGMLADSRDYLALAWWLAAFPGLALTLTVLAVNLLGDWLRDVLDPRARV